MAKKKHRQVLKSADDGRFKSRAYAKKHPKECYEQTVKTRRPRKPKSK